VIGLDGDPRVLGIVRKKSNLSGQVIELKKGLSFDFPFPENSIDLVVSSLVFHHLTSEDKKKTAQEIYRVLKPAGELHVADWGKAPDFFMRAVFLTVQLLDGFKTTGENIKGMLPQYFRDVGFHSVDESKQYRTILGSISMYKAVKP